MQSFFGTVGFKQCILTKNLTIPSVDNISEYKNLFIFQLWTQKIPKSRKVFLSFYQPCVCTVRKDIAVLWKHWNIIKNSNPRGIDS